MTEAQKIKVNDLVTVDLGPDCTASNTFHVLRKTRAECVLSHPLAPECCMLKADDELNRVQPSLPNSTERCLMYASRHREFLSYNLTCDLESLIYFFIFKKKLSNKQLSDLSQIVGTISHIQLNGSLDRAAKYVNDNVAFLDDFNMIWYNNYKKFFQDIRKITSKSQKTAVFNMAGFVIAQLGQGVSSVKQG